MDIEVVLSRLSGILTGERPLSRTAIIGFAIGLLAGVLIFVYIWRFVYRPAVSPHRNLPGPKSESLFWGNIKEIIKSPPLAQHQKWVKQHGKTLRYTAFMGTSRIWTEDITAISYILNHTELFWKSEQTRKGLARILGDGLITAEGPPHKRQRRMLNPSFSGAAVKEMLPIFWDKSYELRDKLVNLIDDPDNTEETSATPAKPEDLVKGGRKIDVMKYLGQCTVDIIGLAGFGYDFKGLSKSDTELYIAFRDLFQVSQGITLMTVIQAFVPYADRLPTKVTKTIRHSKAVIEQVGRQLLEDKKKAVNDLTSGKLEKGHDIGKDLLSIIVRANMGTDLRPDQKLSDAEVMAQITTFLFAGNETSGTSLTWVLYELAKKPEVQARLRQECQGVPDERPTADALNGLIYLENTLREVLRLQTPVPSTQRAAIAPANIPLSQPIRGRDGKMMDHIPVGKGDDIFVPLLPLNTDPEIWGSDAAEFNPDRYDRSTEDRIPTPGVYANLMTFGAGPKNCIGYRFALLEMKAILFVLIRSFSFDLLPSNPEIERKQAVVMRPRIVGEESAGLQMPLIVKTLSS